MLTDPADFMGDLVATRVEAKIIIDRADDRIRISLGVLVDADSRAIWVSGRHIQVGTEADSTVSYEVVGWDGDSGCLLAVRTDGKGDSQ